MAKGSPRPHQPFQGFAVVAVVHPRDIVGHEVRRRAADDSEASPDPGGILFDLPDLLADAPTPSGGQRGRPVSIDEPGPVAIQLVERLDAAAPPSAMASIEDVDENQLRELLEIIRSFELEMSAVRRQLHERIDSIQSEIGRRYRDGEASIDNLLG